MFRSFVSLVGSRLLYLTVNVRHGPPVTPYRELHFPVTLSSEFSHECTNVLLSLKRSHAAMPPDPIAVLTQWPEHSRVDKGNNGMETADPLESYLIPHPDCTFTPDNQEASGLSNRCCDAEEMPEGKEAEE